MRLSLVPALPMLGLLLAVPGTDAAAAPVASSARAEREDAGAQAYAAYCADCHGARLDGARAPSLLAARWREPGSAPALERGIRAGVPARGMPGWDGALSDATIRALTDFILRANAAAASRGTATATRAADARRRVASALHELEVEPIVTAGLDRPTSLALLPDGTALVADAQGLRALRDGRLAPPVVGLPAHDALGDVAPHPDYAWNGWLYLTYACSAACGHAERHVYALVRGRLRDGRWSDGERLASFGDGDASYGVAKLAFDGAGHVWFTLSGAERPGLDPDEFGRQIERPQDLASHRGKIFRLHDDGRVPADNPFVGREDALPAIWSLGHRGLSGLHHDRESDTLWATEHGPWGGDELNRVERGGHYGWPRVSLGYHYAGAPIGARQAPGLVDPLFHWTPSVGVSGVLVYRGTAFPHWRGDLLVGSLGERVGRTLYRFRLVDGGPRLYEYPTDPDGRVRRDATGQALPRAPRFEEVLPDVGRIRDLDIGPDGAVWLLLEHPGRIVRLAPAASAP